MADEQEKWLKNVRKALQLVKDLETSIDGMSEGFYWVDAVHILENLERDIFASITWNKMIKNEKTQGNLHLE
jgi:hypothetical protein